MANLRRSFLLLSLIAAALGATNTKFADAGTYLSLGIGTNAEISGDLGQHFSDDGGAGQFAIGHRLGPVAVEAALQGSRLDGISALALQHDYSTISLGIQLKYFINIKGGFEAYLQGGFHRNWLADTDRRTVDAQGSGYRIGGGVQYSIKVPALAQGAIWLDFMHQRLGLTGADLPDLSGSARTLVLGMSFGL